MHHQEIICVLGMHRSGTSLLTRILNLIGIALGPDEILTSEPVASNSKGYWENSKLTDINDQILARFGGRWDTPPTMPPRWETTAAVADLKVQAQQLVQDHFGDAPLWGWKDPRTCLTLPFWQELFPSMRYLLCLRNPREVANSLATRDQFPIEKSMRLWLMYVSSALNYSRDKSRLLVFYEDLVADGLGQLPRLAEFVGVPERANDGIVRNAVAEFIEPTMRHHRERTDVNGGNSRLEKAAQALYIATRNMMTPGPITQAELSVRLLEAETLLHKISDNRRWNLLTAYRKWKA
jgi:hypothetical protein